MLNNLLGNPFCQGNKQIIIMDMIGSKHRNKYRNHYQIKQRSHYHKLLLLTVLHCFLFHNGVRHMIIYPATPGPLVNLPTPF